MVKPIKTNLPFIHFTISNFYTLNLEVQIVIFVTPNYAPLGFWTV
jgi:hypothetical protein